MINSIPFNKFKCPICGEIHDIKDCVLIRQDVGKELISRESRNEMFRTYHVKHYKVSYYNIRICKSCKSSRDMTMSVVLGLFACAIIAYVVVNMIIGGKFGLANIFGSLLIIVLGGGMILGFVVWIIEKLQEIDIDVAMRNNAIDTDLF